jgi:DNA-binding NarL/FixJ family response regulator
MTTETAQTTEIKIMVVEDNAAYRDVLTLAVNGQDDMVLVGQFGTTEIALRTLEVTPATDQPDILLLDLRLPGMNGLDAIPLIHAAAPATRIIVLSQSDEPQNIVRAISAGVSGYLLKEASLKQITDGIHTVAAGGASLDQNVARFILDSMRKPAPTTTGPLTDREQEILGLLAEGLLKKEIATQLGIGYSTVDTHVSHIYAKLQVANAPAAVSEAYRRGILRTPGPRG